MTGTQQSVFLLRLKLWSSRSMARVFFSHLHDELYPVTQSKMILKRHVQHAVLYMTAVRDILYDKSVIYF